MELLVVYYYLVVAMIAIIRSLLRQGAKVSAGGFITCVGGATAYSYTEQGAGFRREAFFWSKILPVVSDYYIQTGQSSPYVRYQKWTQTGLYKRNISAGGCDDGPGAVVKQPKIAEGPINNNNHAEHQGEEENDGENENDTIIKERRRDLIKFLHDKHAPTIFQVMLDLKGLYIKLGQVLSVTALPVPEPYRILFRTLQSNVPGHEEFDSVVKPTLQREFGVTDLEELFEFIEPVPCGAASIGQAHRARLNSSYTYDNDTNNDGNNNDTVIQIEDRDRDVIIKVQYPDAAWQVPADIDCVGDFLKICIWAGVVEKESAKMSYDEFSRQFLSELDYDRERQNLEIVHESSLNPQAPYLKHGVIVPKVHQNLCTNKVITMEFLPGPTMESEAKRQLELLGIDTSGGITQVIKNAAKNAVKDPVNNEEPSRVLVRRMTTKGTLYDDDDVRNRNRKDRRDDARINHSWRLSTASEVLGRFISFDSILWIVRTYKRMVLLSQACTVSIVTVLPSSLVSIQTQKWVDEHRSAAEEAERLGEIEDWCTALFDVHGHQIFNLGLFNADPHPGNILVVANNDKKNPGRSKSKNTSKASIGLIDFGQCKSLTKDEQTKVANLIVSVANNEPDENIANAFRDMDIITKNNSTEFLAEFGRLMFGPFEAHHLNHKWHMQLHQKDKVLYFPKELSMVYRTSLLLRGLAVSLQLNYSVGDQWKNHAQMAIDRKTASSATS